MGPTTRPDRESQPTDTCARCGLRRATKALEERGVQIRLCDDCYWGREPQDLPGETPPAA